MESKRTVFKRRCSFRHDDSRRGKKAQSSSPAPRSQTHSDGRRAFERTSPQGQQLPFRKEKSQKHADNYLAENCTNPSFDFLASFRMSTLHNQIGMRIQLKVRIQAH